MSAFTRYAWMEHPKKLTTREVTGSSLLMTMIGSNRNDTKLATSIVATVGGPDRQRTPETPIYDVRVSINGIDLDFRDFATEIQRQLDDMVMRRAGELIAQTIGDKLDDLTRDAHEGLDALKQGIRKQAMEMLGYKPWNDQDDRDG